MTLPRDQIFYFDEQQSELAAIGYLYTELTGSHAVSASIMRRKVDVPDTRIKASNAVALALKASLLWTMATINHAIVLFIVT